MSLGCSSCGSKCGRRCIFDNCFNPSCFQCFFQRPRDVATTGSRSRPTATALAVSNSVEESFIVSYHFLIWRRVWEWSGDGSFLDNFWNYYRVLKRAKIQNGTSMKQTPTFFLCSAVC
jgi:hypothetical protein